MNNLKKTFLLLLALSTSVLSHAMMNKLKHAVTSSLSSSTGFSITNQNYPSSIWIDVAPSKSYKVGDKVDLAEVKPGDTLESFRDSDFTYDLLISEDHQTVQIYTLPTGKLNFSIIFHGNKQFNNPNIRYHTELPGLFIHGNKFMMKPMSTLNIQNRRGNPTLFATFCTNVVKTGEKQIAQQSVPNRQTIVKLDPNLQYTLAVAYPILGKPNAALADLFALPNVDTITASFEPCGTRFWFSKANQSERPLGRFNCTIQHTAIGSWLVLGERIRPQAQPQQQQRGIEAGRPIPQLGAQRTTTAASQPAPSTDDETESLLRALKEIEGTDKGQPAEDAGPPKATGEVYEGTFEELKLETVRPFETAPTSPR